MRSKHIYIALLVGPMVLNSCDSYLDLNPISDATSTNAYNTASDAEAALIGAYDSFQAEYYIWDNVIFSDIISDNHYAGGDNPEVFAVDNLDIQPVNGRLFNNWSQLYSAIAKVNVVLAKVPGMTDPKIDVGHRREQTLGEAAFVRAHHYLQSVPAWERVPVIRAPVASPDPA